MAMAPFVLAKDRNGSLIHKFMDCYETVRLDTTSNPMYYGDLHPDGQFVIRKHQDAGLATEHITFYKGAFNEVFATIWASRAGLTYVEYDALY